MAKKKEISVRNNYGLAEPQVKPDKNDPSLWAGYYYYWKEDGKKSYSNTGGFAKKSQAGKAAKEKQKKSYYLMLEKQKDSAEQKDYAELDLDQALDRYIDYTASKKHIRSKNHKASYRTDWENARQLKSKHMDPDIRFKKLKNLEDYDFAQWLAYINVQEYPNNKTSGEYAFETVNRMRTTIYKFLDYLEDHRYFYFDLSFPKRLRNDLKEKKIKKRGSGEREDLNVPTYEDVKKLVSKYDRTTFFGEYCYCLFMFMFFSGCRISEVVSIQIKDIDWEEGEIHIKNSIHQREDREEAKKNLNKDITGGKTPNAERYLPMMNCYRNMLKTYYEKYRMEFTQFPIMKRKGVVLFPQFIKDLKEKGLAKSDEEYFADAFLFPKLQTRYDNKEQCGIHEYQNAKWVNAELERACKANGLSRYTCMSFRHANARLLAYDLKMLEGEAADLFGHGDDGKILKEIYEELKPKEKCHRLKQKYNTLFYRNPEAEKKKEQERKKRIEAIEKVPGFDKKQKEMEMANMQKLIEKHISEGYSAFYYDKDKEDIVTELIKKYHYDKEIFFIVIE